MKVLKNILLVSGSGRNSGKTTVACHIISQLAVSGIVYGLKITPHFHITDQQQKLVAEGSGYKIYAETNGDSEKDSSRMLNAGANKVFFVQCMDNDIPKAISHIKELIPDKYPIVCESGSLANSYKPGLHILVTGINADNTKKSYLANLQTADVFLQQKDFSQSTFNYRVEYRESDWSIVGVGHDQVENSKGVL